MDKTKRKNNLAGGILLKNISNILKNIREKSGINPFKTIFLILILVVYLFRTELLSSYANIFNTSSYTKGADAILILSGNPSTRIEKAVELYKEGYAPKILLTTTIRDGDKYHHIIKSQMDIAKEALEYENIKDFVILPSSKNGATSTFDEAYDLANYVQKNNLKKVILVTDCYHTARSIYAFKKVFSKLDIKTQLEIAGAKNNDFNETNWWHSEAGITAYVLEPIKFFFYFFRTTNMQGIKES